MPNKKRRNENKDYTFAERQGLVVAQSLERFARSLRPGYVGICARAKNEVRPVMSTRVHRGDVTAAGRTKSLDFTARFEGGVIVFLELENLRAEEEVDLGPSYVVDYEAWYLTGAAIIGGPGESAVNYSPETLREIHNNDVFGWYKPDVD